MSSALPEVSRSQSPESFLYTEVVKSFLGARAALVASVLISYGRASIRELSKNSKLPVAVVKKVLVSFIQLNCVVFWADEKKTTYYSFNETGVLTLLYSGDIISYIDELYKDDLCTQIIQNFMNLGNLTIEDYLSSQKESLDKEAVFKIENSFAKLVKDKYLKPIQATNFSPLADLWMKVYKKEYVKLSKSSPSLSELKKKAEATNMSKLEFSKIIEFEPPNLFITDRATSIYKVNPQVPLSFNLERFLKARRTSQLVQLCAHRVGKISSLVYQQGLRSVEKNSVKVVDPLGALDLNNTAESSTLKSVHDEGLDDEPTVTSLCFNARDVLKTLPKTVVLGGSILAGPVKRKHSAGDGDGSAKRVKTENGFAIPGAAGPAGPAGPAGVLEDEDDEDDFAAGGDGDGDSEIAKLSIIDQHLRLLSNSGIPFLKKANNGSFYVPFNVLKAHLRQQVSDTLVGATLGPQCARILRCVRENRLCTEKLINSVALLKDKEGRSLISTLVKFNFLEIQEVPKSADRAASKSVFLYRISDKHSYDGNKQNLCFNMGLLLDKMELLRAENSLLLTKISRDDVRGKESEYLLPSEQLQLQAFREQQLQMVTKVQRLLTLWEVFKF